MRLKGEREEISYNDTLAFFNNRAGKYKADNPYSVTMYQDNNPELVKKRNAKEMEKLLPLLRLDNASRVLDIACGIGRWSDAINVDIDEYCGIDFCEGFIQKAKELNQHRSNRYFLTGEGNKLSECLKANGKGKYNRVLVIGAMMYLNDMDVDAVFKQINENVEENTVICIREPIGITERLTLKELYSEELQDMYNAIYRTRDELVEVLSRTLLANGFKINEEAFLFEDGLNNRKETAQYYFILER